MRSTLQAFVSRNRDAPNSRLQITAELGANYRRRGRRYNAPAACVGETSAQPAEEPVASAPTAPCEPWGKKYSAKTVKQTRIPWGCVPCDPVEALAPTTSCFQPGDGSRGAGPPPSVDNIRRSGVGGGHTRRSAIGAIRVKLAYSRFATISLQHSQKAAPLGNLRRHGWAAVC